jgi:hypothetical protein
MPRLSSVVGADPARAAADRRIQVASRHGSKIAAHPPY